MYQLTENGVLRKNDKAWIPDCADNRDWQEYQQWLKEGNTPEPMAAQLPQLSESVLNPLAISNGKARIDRIQKEQDAERQRLDDTFTRYFQEIREWLATATAP